MDYQLLKYSGSKYSASFTAGSLLFNEFNSLIEILCYSNIESEKSRILTENLFKLNSESSRKRVYSEIKKRVKSVDKQLWAHFINCGDKERRTLLFYVILKSYPLIFDFQSEVVLGKFRTLDLNLSKRDIEVFLVKKSSTHPEIDRWSNATREKIKNTLMLILSQASTLRDNQIISLDLGKYFWREFLSYGDDWFLELSLLKKNERENIIGAPKHEIS